MFKNQILTPIDDFVSLIKKNPDIEIYKASQMLNVDIKYIERWVIILEERKVLKVTNKGFKSFLKLNNEALEVFNFDSLKQEFIQKAKRKDIPYKDIQNIWKSFLSKNDNSLMLKFVEKAKKETRHNDREIIRAWNNFKKDFEVL